MTDKQTLFHYRLGQAEEILHKLFAARQESDYRELVTFSKEDASDHLKLAGEFVTKIKNYILQEDH